MSNIRLTVWILNISGPNATNKTHNNDLFKGGMCIIRKQHVKTCARPFKTEKNIQVWHSKIRKRGKHCAVCQSDNGTVACLSMHRSYLFSRARPVHSALLCSSDWSGSFIYLVKHLISMFLLL